MPIQLSLFTNMFTGDLYSILNVAIVLCSFVESYIFPFAIVKWMIVVTKYWGPLWQFRNARMPCLKCNDKLANPEFTFRSRYEYSLQLMTSFKRKVTNSHVCVSVEADPSDHNNEMWKWIQLSYCGQDCQKIPSALWKMYGVKVQHLDLSYNSIETLMGLEHFTRLQELILDNNKLGDAVKFPCLPHLKTLSLNNNQITDLEGLIDKISERYPNLTYLSLLSNKACPNQLSDLEKDDSDYQRYRYFVIYKLQNLRFLDSRRVSAFERSEAAIRGEFMRVRRPRPDVVDAPSGAISDQLRPLPVDLAALGKHKGAYGRCQYKYTGKHSEGNRFIVNSDL